MKTAKRPDILSMMGREELNLDSSYSCGAWECINDRIVLIHMRKTKKLTRGPRKDCTVYFGKGMQTGVTMAEIDAYMAKWEQDTGLCVDCGGDGIAEIGWHHETGLKYAPCKRCNATGKARKEVQS